MRTKQNEKKKKKNECTMGRMKGEKYESDFSFENKLLAKHELFSHKNLSTVRLFFFPS